MKRKIGTALVVGAGISGIRAALDLAEFGYGVTLIDRSPHLGGILSQLDYQFPTDRCGMCKMLPLVDRDASSQYCLRKGLFHENIDILLSAELISLEGEPGHFQVRLQQKPKWIDPDLCVGCGICTDVCPVEVQDRFNAGLSMRKAIYLPVPHAIPNSYMIDADACTRCGECEKVCPAGAVRLAEQERQNFRILVVDDELIVRESLKEWLREEEGYYVNTAESGPDALELLAEKQYHLLLTDIKMPGMDGVEVLQKAKEIYPDLVVIMMTAYATVETAVDAMKIGALDYLVKPFEPDKLIPMVLGVYEDFEAARGLYMEVDSLVLCGGTGFYNPTEGKNTFGYGLYPDVVTGIEFERILSSTGPFQGKPVRLSDGKPIQKAAWIQCVGSRDLQTDADFCSNICCMYAIKEALVFKEKAGKEVEASIFYMDMRTPGKSFQRYCDQARHVHGIRFQRARIHSVIPGDNNSLSIRYADEDGKIHDELQDMIILSTGQRPAPNTKELSEMTGIGLNPWGFAETRPFSLSRTACEGIVLGGAFSGLKDIGDSVIQASSAALSASRVIHANGGGLAPEISHDSGERDVSREEPRILVAVCTCKDALYEMWDQEKIAARLLMNPQVEKIEFQDSICTAEGWMALVELSKKEKANRILIGACCPYVYTAKLRELGHHAELSPSLIDVVDIRTPLFSVQGMDKNETGTIIESRLETGIARLRQADPFPVSTLRIHQKALVIGGGIAGMTAAIAIADHGFDVELVEQADCLGGNLLWLKNTLEGHSTNALLEESISKTEKHPKITIHTKTQIIASCGEVGHFLTTIEKPDGPVQTLEHGVTILATGGTEASTTAYGYGTSQSIITQKELEIKISQNTLDKDSLRSVVMIQCVDSREEPRNYCSRVCCTSALKHALHLKTIDPDIAIYILYRDMMSCGFTETYFTQARRAGVIFIRYDLKNKPLVQVQEKGIQVTVREPVLGQDVQIEADMAVLATGIIPNLPPDLASAFGTDVDKDGFFQEAESKWRPVDSLREGVFACGLALSPRTIAETVATAEAAAQRSLRILSRQNLPAGKIVAKIRHAICSLCEQCISACPYNARTLRSDPDKIEINPVMCQGCGSCVTACPNGASVLEGFRKQQMLDIIDAAFI